MSTVNTESKFHHAHHFKSLEHEYQSAKQGIWLFMATEVLMFGGLFVAYAIYKSLYAPIFHVGSSFLDVKLGSINTVVLITSSFTMALGIYFNQTNQAKKAIVALAITIACAFGFMGIKYVEYSHKIHDGLLPGKNFKNTEFHNRLDAWVDKLSIPQQEALISHMNVSHKEINEAGKRHLQELAAAKEKLKKFAPLYFGFYFAMTGLHGFHVVIGACLILWVLIRTAKGHFGSEYYTPVEGVGIFWHIVDLIWIYLFPLLYLVG